MSTMFTGRVHLGGSHREGRPSRGDIFIGATDSGLVDLTLPNGTVLPLTFDEAESVSKLLADMARIVRYRAGVGALDVA